MIVRGWLKQVSLLFAAVLLFVAVAVPAVSKAAASNELPNIVQTASPNRLLALDDEGNVWCKAIHIISVKDNFHPKPMVKVKGLDKVASLSKDGEYAVKEDGTVWKLDMYTNEHDKDLNERQSKFVGERISYLDNIMKMDSLNGITYIALDKDGKVWVLEPANYWEKRDPLLKMHDYASLVEGIADVQDMIFGGSSILFLKKDGTVWAKDYGNLNYEIIRSAVPEQIKELTDIAKIGRDVALKKDGTVWAWGKGSLANNGKSSAAESAAPYQVPGLSDIVDLSQDFQHALFVKKDGTVWRWGYIPKESEELGQNPDLVWTEASKVYGIEDAVSVSTQFSFNNMWTDVVVKKDGTVWMQEPKSHNEFYEKLLQVDFK